jgi:hypothetical protein
MILLDVAFKFLKPTLREAPPQLWLQVSETPLQPSANDLFYGGELGFVDVIGSFLKGLLVRMLL